MYIWIMELKLNIGYQDLLTLVKQLSAKDLAQFKADVAEIQPDSLSVPGTPVSVDDLMENLQLAETQIQNGEVYTSEQVKQHIESWKTK